LFRWAKSLSLKNNKGTGNIRGETMAKKMGRYCKAYYLSDFRGFSGWPPTLEYLKTEKRYIDNNEVEEQRQLSDGDILYLQENYVVTDGIFLEENVVFNRVTPDWIGFCTKKLAFELPVYEHSGRSNESNT
jgi:hypothetical protein